MQLLHSIFASTYISIPSFSLKLSSLLSLPTSGSSSTLSHHFLPSFLHFFPPVTLHTILALSSSLFVLHFLHPSILLRSQPFSIFPNIFLPSLFFKHYSYYLHPYSVSFSPSPPPPLPQHQYLLFHLHFTYISGLHHTHHFHTPSHTRTTAQISTYIHVRTHITLLLLTTPPCTVGEQSL